MDLYVSEYVNEFECMGADCPYTCCKGWQIIVDKETSGHIMQSESKLAIFMRLIMQHKTSGAATIRKIAGRCPMYTRDRLCRLQAADQMELMPMVCRLYPRTSFVYGARQEVSLELSCYRASSIFISWVYRHKGYDFRDILRLKNSTSEYPIEWYANDPDLMFVDYLAEERDRISQYMSACNNEMSDDIESDADQDYNLPGRLNGILTYIKQVHACVARDNLEAARNIDLPPVSERESSYAVMPLTLLNNQIYGVLEQSRIAYREPVLYKLMKDYRRHFGDVYEADADYFFDQKIKEMLTDYPELKRVIAAYFTYEFGQSYISACEDYYILRPALLSILMTQFLMLFFLVDYMDGSKLSQSRQAEILSNMERALAHNPYICDTFVVEIRNRIYKEQ